MYGIGKRLFDIFLSLLLLLPAAIIIFFAAIWVRFESDGNAIFRQVRVGRDGRQFTIFKLRTMLVSTGDKASHEVSESSITKSGMVFRRCKIDELPQIWSVLIGNMSFVGPRPCLPQQIALVNFRKLRGALDVRPGITGQAQIMGIDMSTPDELSCIDAEYARNHSFWGDLEIIFKTVSGSGLGDAANRPRSQL